MISYQDFHDGLKELSDLTGHRISKNTVDALYKAMNGLDNRDFTKAVQSLAESDDRANLFYLKRYTNMHMMERLEREAEEAKRKEERETKQFWLAHFKEGKCLSHECGFCPKKYCMIVSNECITQLKRLFADEITSEEMHKELAEEFPGIGFEQECGVEPF
jgi:hypothetical protein